LYGGSQSKYYHCLSQSCGFGFYGHSQRDFMLISFSLNKQISCDQICNQIQKMIHKFQKETGQVDNLIMVVDIKIPTETTDSYLPKLELKN